MPYLKPSQKLSQKLSQSCLKAVSFQRLPFAMKHGKVSYIGTRYITYFTELALIY